MKKMKKVILGFAALAVFFTSCKEDNTAPVISNFNIEGETYADSTISILATLTDGEGLKSAKLTVETNGVVSELENKSLEGNSHSYTYSYKIPSTASKDQVYKFTLEVMDDAKKEEDVLSTSDSRSITILSVAGGAITSYSAKMFGGQSNPTYGSYWKSSDGSVVTMTAADANPASIDLVFAYGTTNLNYFAAPNDADIAVSHSNIAGWSTKNATKLKMTTLTATEFDAITDDATIVTEATGASATKVNALAVGNVFAFETVGGKKGLVKVKTISGTVATDRAIEIDIKIQN